MLKRIWVFACNPVAKINVRWHGDLRYIVIVGRHGLTIVRVVLGKTMRVAHKPWLGQWDHKDVRGDPEWQRLVAS